MSDSILGIVLIGWNFVKPIIDACLFVIIAIAVMKYLILDGITKQLNAAIEQLKAADHRLLQMQESLASIEKQVKYWERHTTAEAIVERLDMIKQK